MRKIRSGAIDAATALVVALVFAILFHPARVRAAKRTGPAAATAAKAPVASDPAFGTYWHDGKAELDGYRYTVTRYGRERRGHAVAVYVTEPFSRSLRVKVDDPSRNPKDTFDVLKLNLIRDFQTGIYDYNTMTSLFVRSGDFEPVKLSFVSTEWCGNVYEELLVNPGLNFHLTAGSPCIDTGTCTGAPTTDFEGDPRPTGASCDMGADEFVP